MKTHLLEIVCKKQNPSAAASPQKVVLLDMCKSTENKYGGIQTAIPHSPGLVGLIVGSPTGSHMNVHVLSTVDEVDNVLALGTAR